MKSQVGTYFLLLIASFYISLSTKATFFDYMICCWVNLAITAVVVIAERKMYGLGYSRKTDTTDWKPKFRTAFCLL